MEETFENKKRGRGRPRKNPGDPVTHYKTRNSSDSLSSTHEYVEFLPDKSLDVYEPYLELFFDTMLERQLIWKRRFIDKSERPWTKDEIFLNNKFPNVYRELDRSSQYLINKVIRANSSSLINMVWKAIVYRLFNSPETFELASLIWEGGIPNYEDYNEQKDKFTEFIDLLSKAGARPFTNAYFVSSSFAVGETRGNAYTTKVLPQIHSKIHNIMDMCLLAESPSEITSMLCSFYGIQKFIAHELFQDMIYISRFTEHQLFQFGANDFTNVGPGSALGIRLLFPSLQTRIEQRKGIYDLLAMAKEKIAIAEQKAGEKFPYAVWNESESKYEVSYEFNLTLNQIEGWLCEFSKYWKMVIGKGKQRQKFNPVSDTDAYEQLDVNTEEDTEEETEETEELL